MLTKTIENIYLNRAIQRRVFTFKIQTDNSPTINNFEYMSH